MHEECISQYTHQKNQKIMTSEGPYDDYKL